MTPETRNAAIAAAVFLVLFGLSAHYLPQLMIFLGERSMVAAVVVAAIFMLSFFIVFWLRGRSRRRDD